MNENEPDNPYLMVRYKNNEGLRWLALINAIEDVTKAMNENTKSLNEIRDETRKLVFVHGWDDDMKGD